MTLPYPPPNPPMIEARWKGGPQVPRDIVIHSAVTPCSPGAARGVGHFFAQHEDKTSAHYGVDTHEVIQYVGDHTVAYHCGWNKDSLAVEMCEYPSLVNMARWWTKPHRQMMTRAVNLVARLCLAYDIPPYYVGAKGLKAGRHGVTTHNAIRLAHPGVTTHWDPGAWPRRLFMRRVRARIAYLKTTEAYKGAAA